MEEEIFYGYRIQPPKDNKKKTIKGEKEVTKFLLDHYVLGEKDPIPLVEFLKRLVDTHEDPATAVAQLATMFPYEYAMMVGFVLGPIANEYFEKLKEKNDD